MENDDDEEEEDENAKDEDGKSDSRGVGEEDERSILKFQGSESNVLLLGQRWHVAHPSIESLHPRTHFQLVKSRGRKNAQSS